MKRRSILFGAMVSALALASVAGADLLLSIPDDIEPPFYLSGGGPFILEGEPWSMNDGEWAVIPFYRTPDLPADFDLLNDSDPNVFEKQLQVKGWLKVTDDFQPYRWQTRGTGAVPMIFVKVSELNAVMANGTLYVGDLAACPSIRYGTASYYQEENHIYGIHPTSHLAVVARGDLIGGGTFDVHVVEVGLELKEVRIVFKN